MIRPSRGTHILIDRERLPLNAAAIVPAGGGPHDLRAALARPDADRHHRQRLRGQPRAPAGRRGRRRVPARCGERVLRDATSASDDVAGAYAGVRPLISTGDPKKSVDISRKAELYETSSGMITITGGKLTTWRRMAKMAVDRLVGARVPRGALPHPRDPARAPGRPGAAAGTSTGVERALARAPRDPLRAVRRAGAEAVRGAARARRSRSSTGMPDLLAEALVAARFEQARSRRRTCCCAARGWACSRAGGCVEDERRRARVAAGDGAPSSAGTAGRSTARGRALAARRSTRRGSSAREPRRPAR